MAHIVRFPMNSLVRCNTSYQQHIYSTLQTSQEMFRTLAAESRNAEDRAYYQARLEEVQKRIGDMRRAA